MTSPSAEPPLHVASNELTDRPKATLERYTRELALEVGAGAETSMWVKWHYTLTDEGGSVERRTWDGGDIRAVFNTLAEEWRNATALESFLVKKAMHFSYQCIIGLGPAVLPLLLESLAEEPRDWFWALAAITREDAAVGIENSDEAAKAWLEWGKGLRRGLPVGSST
jgi:hypothetical protein